MARAHFVKKARKDVPNSDIKKGESYFWWKFRYGGKHVSRTTPKPSQLTQSAFWGAVYSIEESYQTIPDFDEIEGQIESIKDELQEIVDETQEKLNNMPEGLQEGDTGQLLQERIDALEQCISELDGVDITIDYADFDEDSGEADIMRNDRAGEIWDEVTGALSNISCG